MAAESGPAFTIDNVDFDAIYEGKAAVEGTELKFERVPWDIGAPQPEIVELERATAFRGDVLDSGCGLGENTLFLAERGYRVTGVDASATAIEQAGQLAQQRGIDPEFVVADVTRFDGFEQRFDTVLDSALYHCLGSEQRQAYSAALHRVTRPGSQLHLFCFADEGRSTFPPPLQVSKDDLNANLGGHWNITNIEPAYYLSSFSRAGLERLANQPGALESIGVTMVPDDLEFDERGRALIGVWRLRADRR